MQFVNTTGNTIYIADLDRYLPYFEDGRPQLVSLDDLKKSQSVQQLVIRRRLDVVSHDDSRLERNLLRLREAHADHHPVPCPAVAGSGGLEVKVRGTFHDYSGYSKANRNLAVGLATQKVKTQVIPLHGRNELNEFENKLLQKLHRPVGDNAILIDSAIPTLVSENPIPCGHRILYTTVEANTVPRQFVSACEKYDEVWVPSSFCHGVLKRAGVKQPITVMPLGVNEKLYHPGVKPYRFHPPLKRFVFLSVFNWHYRKGYDALLRAYLEEFREKDDCTLLIVAKDVQGKPTVDEQIKGFVERYGHGRPPHIVRVGRTIPEYEMSRLYRSAHCFVLPSRGEGFGLPYLEAIFCGLPVIATGGTGESDFLSGDTSYVVGPDRRERMAAGVMKVHYWEEQEFHALTDRTFIARLRNAMRDARKGGSVWVETGRARKEALNTYTLERISSRVKQKLEKRWEMQCLSV
jgi:glycosyltransferase involved in cell wall biosynthesis